MSYIYDILLNFNETYYDFYEWNISDNIKHIRKIPLFKINNKDLINLKNNKVKIDMNFLNKIKNKTEIFSNSKIENFEYTTLFCNDEVVIAITFDNNGYSEKYSSLLIDELYEVLETADDLKETNINYSIIDKNKENNFLTRKDYECYKYITKQLKKLESEDNTSKLEYLYYECFGKMEKDIKKIIDKLNNEITNKWDFFNQKIYDFFQMTSVKK